VLGTGWYAADAARVEPGSTVAVVGDGAVGLMGVLAAKQMGASRIFAISRHKTGKASRSNSARSTSSPRGAMTAWRGSNN
jgi:threonine dehydrogenase-like Zn-dependent dehydrogenase